MALSVRTNASHHHTRGESLSKNLSRGENWYCLFQRSHYQHGPPARVSAPAANALLGEKAPVPQPTQYSVCLFVHTLNSKLFRKCKEQETVQSFGTLMPKVCRLYLTSFSAHSGKEWNIAYLFPKGSFHLLALFIPSSNPRAFMADECLHKPQVWGAAPGSPLVVTVALLVLCSNVSPETRFRFHS